MPWAAWSHHSCLIALVGGKENSEGGMAGSQQHHGLGLLEEMLESQFNNPGHPMETLAQGLKSLLFLRLKHLTMLALPSPDSSSGLWCLLVSSKGLSKRLLVAQAHQALVKIGVGAHS